ncbi:hypothetical protein MINS_40020 [Mycolicibacterium insubricum]|jgi:hypothetical protein|nr:hypothetical protein [Mycolicibacterium insubricum]MCB9441900.1 hypothetical protein [Mycolicibacterium sp.]MCV7083996.1 hypothetical protein [Mycolicibacterium insubricum]BBZ68573.1 hypothetical protein MINS_40020 [Mycolicibacterium insubricum]
MPKTQMFQRVLLLGAAALTVASFTAGCPGSEQSNATCDDYARADFKQQGEIQRALLKAHDLDTTSVSNTIGLTSAIEDKCGWEHTNSKNGKATRNGSKKIDDLINWNSKQW